MAHYKFHDDLDICSLASSFRSQLRELCEQKEKFQEEYEIYNTIVDKSHNVADRAKAANILKRYKKLLPIVQDDTLPDVYMEKISPYIATYQSLQPDTCIFGMDNCPNIPHRVVTILHFLRVTADYLDITYECTFSLSRICSRCYSVMSKVGQSMICTCGSTQTCSMLSNKAPSSSIRSCESSYKADMNYAKEYKHVAGLIYSGTEDQIEDIRSYLYRSGISDITHEKIREAIGKCGYNNYNDTNYIHAKVSGEPLPQIEDYLEITKTRFNLYYNVFVNVDKEGKNVTNIHFLIRLFLWQEKVSYKEDWFSPLSEKTRNKHRRNAKKICNILARDYPSMCWDVPPDW